MLAKFTALFVILGCLLSQLLLPWLIEIPCQTMTGAISFLWLIYGVPAGLVTALAGGFILDILSFDTPFGLFLFSYITATFIATRFSRFSFQNALMTYLLFATIVSFLSPLIELILMLLKHQTATLPLIVWHVIIPAISDLFAALFWGMIALTFLSRQKALKIV